MNTAGLALWGCAGAALFACMAGGCGGAIAPDIGDGGGGSSGAASSSGATGSSSGGSSSGGISSSSGIGSSGSSGSGSSSGATSSSSGGVSSSSGGSSSGIIGSSSGPNGAIDFEGCAAGGSLCGNAPLNFYAEFTQASSQTPGCTVTTSNGCSLYDCSSAQPTPYVSAGTLTISGSSIATPVAVTPGGQGTYNYSSTSIFSPGEKLTVSASGAVVPAFGPVTVLAPAQVTMVTPVAPYTVSGKTNLGVQWTGGVSGDVFILEGVTNSSQSYFLCEWDAGMAKNYVPQSIVAGIGTGQGDLIYGQYASTTFTAGEFTIYDSAFWYGGDAASYQ